MFETSQDHREIMVYVNGEAELPSISADAVAVKHAIVLDTGEHYILMPGETEWESYTIPGGGGGGGETVPELSDVNFFDYDGTLLYSYTATDASALTEMPENPTHEGLNSEGWNYSLAQMQSTVTAQGKCDVGQMYSTPNRVTRIYVDLPEGRLSPYLGLKLRQTIHIDWGDGSASEDLSGTNANFYAIQHTYADPGEYCIEISHDATADSASVGALYGGSYSRLLTAGGTTSGNSADLAYAACIKRVELGYGIQIENMGLANCINLESVTLWPQAPGGTVAVSGNRIFEGCKKLKAIVIPPNYIPTEYMLKGCVSLKTVSVGPMIYGFGEYVFFECVGLERFVYPVGTDAIQLHDFHGCSILSEVVFPPTVTGIYAYTFQDCTNLKTFTVPDNCTIVYDATFKGCTALANVYLPSGITAINAEAFSGCTGLGAMHIGATTPPTLGTNALLNIPADCVFYVPAAAVETYQAATGWSDIATQIEAEPTA